MRIMHKTFLTLLILALVPLSILGFLALSDIQDMQDNAVTNIQQMGDTAIDDSTQALNALGEQIIQQRAEDVAKQLEIYINAHPDMTVSDLQQDPVFRSLAVQSVGETGYTAITDVETLICRFHASPKIVDLDLHNLADKLPGFWGVMSQTEGGVPSEGYYDWEEADGSITKKYMYIAIVDARTADNVQFSVAATTYISEFNAPVLTTQAKIDSKTEEVTANIQSTAQNVKRDTVTLFIVMLILVLGVSFLFSKSITGPIMRLTVAGNKIADGKLNTEMPEITSNDEIKELGNTMNLLVGAIKYLKKDTKKKKRKKK